MAKELTDGSCGRTPHGQAVRMNDLESFRMLLASCGMTPLGQAVRMNDLESARMLLAAGAQPAGSHEKFLLFTAIQYTAHVDPRLQMIRILLEHGADPNESSSSQAAALFFAVEEANAQVLEMLLEFRADPNARFARGQRCSRAPGPTPGMTPGMTPLMLAASKRSGRIVNLLLGAGADAKLLDDEGCSAADLAAHAGDPVLTQLLIDAGAPIKVDAKTRHSATLLRAIREQEIAAALAALAAGADPNTTDERGQTALIWAAQHGLVEVVQALLAAGADPNRVSKSHPCETALSHASRRGNAQVVRLLLASGADVNQPVVPGSIPAAGRTVYINLDTVLHAAATNGTTEVMALLIAAGADINAVGQGGLTPLVAAVNCRRMDSVDLLLKAGAVIRPQDELWLAPYRFAKAAEQPAYRAFVDKVSAISGQPAQPMEIMPGVYTFRIPLDPKPEEPPPSDPVEAGRRLGERFCRESAELDQKVDAILCQLAEEARQAGFLLLDAGTSIGCGPMVQFLVLLPTGDKYEAMVAFGVYANDQEMGTAEIVRWFRELEAEEPFDLRGIDSKTVDIEFHQLVKDPDGLAHRLQDFCNDLLGDIAGWLRSNRRITFWWD